MLNSTFVLSGLRFHPDRMALLYKDFIMTLEDSSTYIWIRDKGVVIGKAEGKVAGLQESILNLRTARFGPPSESDAATLAGLTDPGVLSKIVVHALTAADWSDLLMRGHS